jgi:hypothetical protein
MSSWDLRNLTLPSVTYSQDSDRTHSCRSRTRIWKLSSRLPPHDGWNIRAFLQARRGDVSAERIHCMPISLDSCFWKLLSFAGANVLPFLRPTMFHSIRRFPPPRLSEGARSQRDNVLNATLSPPSTAHQFTLQIYHHISIHAANYDTRCDIYFSISSFLFCLIFFNFRFLFAYFVALRWQLIAARFAFSFFFFVKSSNCGNTVVFNTNRYTFWSG